MPVACRGLASQRLRDTCHEEALEESVLLELCVALRKRFLVNQALQARGGWQLLELWRALRSWPSSNLEAEAALKDVTANEKGAFAAFDGLSGHDKGDQCPVQGNCIGYVPSW